MLSLLLFPLLSLFSGVHALPQVTLGQTVISGQDLSDGVQFFGGIPYAKPPLGSLRFRKPILLTRLATSHFNASAFGNVCPQNVCLSAGNCAFFLTAEKGASTSSEDCLTINIFRPANLSTMDNLPILFWTHGGGYVIGSSSEFDGSGLVARSVARGTPIIYVSFNYRLGPLGFPLGEEADKRRVLNLALHDQTVALKWVQANVHVFGGEKNKVTVFGESAGAMMLGVQYLNPHFRKLARGAIFESGSANSLPTFRAAEREPVWQDFVSKVASCSSVATSGRTLDCLRNATEGEISIGVLNSTSLEAFPWAPTLDKGKHSVYPDYPSRLYARGQFARLPFIAGNNRDEGTAFSIQQPALTDAEMKALVVGQHLPPIVSQQALENATDRLLHLYPDDPVAGSPYGTGEDLFGLPRSFKRYASLIGDMVYAATRRQWIQNAAHVGIKTYAYHFTHPQTLLPSQFGVGHGSEIPYVYGQIASNDTVGQSLSIAIMDYWISFTVSLDPNDGKGVDRPIWPQYKERNKVLLQLDGGNTTVVADNFRKEQIAYLIENALVLRR